MPTRVRSLARNSSTKMAIACRVLYGTSEAVPCVGDLLRKTGLEEIATRGSAAGKISLRLHLLKATVFAVTLQ